VTIQYPEEKRPVKTRFKGAMCSNAMKTAGKMHWLFIVLGGLSGRPIFVESADKR